MAVTMTAFSRFVELRSSADNAIVGARHGWHQIGHDGSEGDARKVLCTDLLDGSASLKRLSLTCCSKHMGGKEQAISSRMLLLQKLNYFESYRNTVPGSNGW